MRLRIDDIELKIYWHEDPQTEVTVENRYNASNLGGYLSVDEASPILWTVIKQS